ncbi:major allergen Pru av 1-like [Euphorbia lathyris]|uniref:major allergen Pru av 1-like n=1 Tax=Euphorbia lathyris TaxID=212925 RepID=UPI0033142451
MGVVTIEREITTSVPQATMFNIFCPENHHLLHKSIPHASVETHEGNGGPGTIKKATFAAHPDHEFKYVKTKAEAIDKANFTIGYSIIEADPWSDKLEKITVVVKVEASSNGGSIIKSCFKYVPKANCELDEAEINANADKIMNFYKVLEN